MIFYLDYTGAEELSSKGLILKRSKRLKDMWKTIVCNFWIIFKESHNKA